MCRFMGLKVKSLSDKIVCRVQKVICRLDDDGKNDYHAAHLMKRKLLTLCSLLLCHTALADSPVWVEGVSASTGWVDTNKTWDHDALMCWAAASSNAVAWWQARHGAAAALAGAPTGKDEIWSTYKAAFGNNGGIDENGIRWWFTGDTENLYPTPSAAGKGNYYSDLILNNSLSIERYALTTYFSPTVAVLSSEILYQINNGSVITLGIYNYNPETMAVDYTSGHAITLWGAEVNADGVITRMFLTDSDDSAERLITAECTEISGLKRTASNSFASFALKSSDDFYDGSKVIGAFTALNGHTEVLPEPATAALSLMTLVGCCLRRRRNNL